MSILAGIVFVVCLFFVFYKRFNDGIFIKHCLSFAAIASFCIMYDPKNYVAFCWVVLLVLSAVGYWFRRRFKELDAANS